MKLLVIILSLVATLVLTGCGTYGYVDNAYVLPQRHGALSSGVATQEFYYYDPRRW